MHKGVLGFILGVTAAVLLVKYSRKPKGAPVSKKTVNGLSTDVNNEFVHKAKQDSILLSADKSIL